MEDLVTPSELVILGMFAATQMNGKACVYADCGRTLEELRQCSEYGMSVHLKLLYDPQNRFPAGTVVQTSYVVKVDTIELVPGTVHHFFETRNTNYLIKSTNK